MAHEPYADTRAAARRTLRPTRLVVPIALLLAFAFVNCGEEDLGPGDPRGQLVIAVSTTGEDLDADGYTVSLDGGTPRPIATNGTATFPNVPAGSHTVALGGVAANCNLTGANPRTVTITDGSTQSVAVAVACAAMLGNLEVRVSTTGDNVDPDGYLVNVEPVASTAPAAGPEPSPLIAEPGQSRRLPGLRDGIGLHSPEATAATAQPAASSAQAEPVPANGTVTFSNLRIGEYTVELTGLAGNCTVTEPNPATGTVTFNETASLAFSVTCTALVGDLQVDVATSGDNPDADGYAVTVDGLTSQAVGANGSVTFSGIAAGDHSVTISGVASNCSVSGSSTTTVTVPAGGAASASFGVTCSSLVGDLTVNVTTTGDDVDPDGYLVVVDGQQNQTVGTSGAVTFTGLGAGDHSVQLTQIAANCTASGPNPAIVTVPQGGVGAIAFTVTCSGLVGDLAVTTVTTGVDLDPNGYTVTVDGQQSQSVGINGAITFTGLAEGDHAVELTGVAANCAVGGSNPRSVTVPANAQASAAFDITCSPLTGSLEVTVTTGGADLDPDGYSVTVDGSASQAVSVNGTVTFVDLLVGDHTVTLADVVANCTVSGASSVTATVPANGTATVAFTVSCVARTGDLDVQVTTTGSDFDPDGYTVTVDGTQSQAVSTAGTVTFADLPEGDHTVELSGVSNNCTVVGTNPLTVTVPFGQTASSSLTVDCTSRVGDLNVTTATTGQDPDPDGFVVSVDGTQNQAIAIDGAITFTGLPEGNHAVELTGVADNCTVNESNPSAVTVPFGGMASVAFTITCVARVGDLDVTTSTTGSDLDPDGYTVTVDGTTTQSVGTGATVTFVGLTEGDHSVELTGLAANCSVAAPNPVTASVPFNGTGSASFTVQCVARTGSLDVTTTTTGEDLDSDGFTVTVDGTTSQAATPTGTITFTDLSEGDHTVELTAVEGNCAVAGSNPVTVAVPYAGTASTSFDVTCVNRTGDLDVTTTTTGEDLDPDGYTVTVDGSQSQAIAATATIAFLGLDEGDHVVELSGLAGNCAVTGTNPLTATVPYGGTAATAFDVTCVALVGNLDVTVVTSGEDLDPDGYTVTVDGTTSQAIAVDGSVTFTALPDGDHNVQLTGLEANCTVTEPNPTTATVPPDGTVTVTWSVSCTPIYGDIEVQVTTTGEDIDGTGYFAVLDGADSLAMAVNDTVMFVDILPGNHSVALADVIGNCRINQATPRNAAVTAGDTTRLVWTITCLPRVGDLRVVVSTTGADLDPDGYDISVDVNADSTATEAATVQDTVTFRGLPTGIYTATLSGLAENCTVQGDNPQTIRVPANGRATLTFAIDCAAITGNLQVTTATTGEDLDTDGYSVTINDTLTQAIGINETLLFSGLQGGDHTVELTGAASNCTILSMNPQTVNVQVGATSTTTIDVSCIDTGIEILVGAGDIASCDSSGDEATADVLDGIPGTVFTAGDNAYPDGTTADFTNCYDPSWGRHRNRTRPTPGNHEYFTTSATPYFDYFGAAAGNRGEGWYSYDMGSWHVVAINTELSVAAGSTQLNWLATDLTTSTAGCTVAYFHRSRFSSGAIGSDTTLTALWQVLYDNGVDLVVSSHDHTYERFALQDPAGNADPTNGIRQFVVGTGGESHGNFGAARPNSEVRDNTTYGVLMLTLRDGSYDWEFVPEAGGTFTDSGSGTCN